MLNFFEDAGVSLSLDADRLKVEGLKQLPPGQAQKIREKIKTHRTEIMRELSNIPVPEPPGMGAEYADLWNRAWRLADYIDNPDGAPIEDRRAKLPELDDLRQRMAAIVNRVTNVTNGENPTATSDSEKLEKLEKTPDTWHTWESSTATTPDTCPAQCKKTGKCYGKAYFEGKPGRAAECDPETCDYRGTPATGRFFDTQSEKGKRDERASVRENSEIRFLPWIDRAGTGRAFSQATGGGTSPGEH